MELVLVKLKTREEEAVKVQEVLTRHGCDISVRLGLHEQAGAACSPSGVIVLQVTTAQAVKSLVRDLKALRGVEARSVSI